MNKRGYDISYDTRVNREIQIRLMNLSARVDSFRIKYWGDFTSEEDKELGIVVQKLNDLARKRVGTF